MDQREFWNGVANEKEFTTPFLHDEFEQLVDKNANILDYGCGYGRTLLELEENSYRNLYGVDFSNEMIKRGKLSSDKIAFKLIDSGVLPFDDDSIDAVILFAVLTTVYKDVEQDKIINEIKRVLKPGGIIYINDFLINDDERNKKRYEKYLAKYGDYGVFELEGGAILRHFSVERFESITKDFKQIYFKDVYHNTMNGNKSHGIIYMGTLR